VPKYRVNCPEVEGPVENPGPSGGREVQPGGTGLSCLDGCGRMGTGRGRGRRCERGVGAGDVGVPGGVGSGSR